MRVVAASPDAPIPAIARLIWSTDPGLMAVMFGEVSVFETGVAHEWPMPSGLLSHRHTSLAVSQTHVVGQRTTELDAQYAASLFQQPQPLSKHTAEQGRAQEAKRLGLDVAADSPAVGFCPRRGLEIEIEARVTHGIYTHVHMTGTMDHLASGGDHAV